MRCTLTGNCRQPSHRHLGIILTSTIRLRHEALKPTWGQYHKVTKRHVPMWPSSSPPSLFKSIYLHGQYAYHGSWDYGSSFTRVFTFPDHSISFLFFL